MFLGLAAHIAFWVILALGGDDLGLRRASVFVAAWIASHRWPARPDALRQWTATGGWTSVTRPRHGTSMGTCRWYAR